MKKLLLLLCLTGCVHDHYPNQQPVAYPQPVYQRPGYERYEHHERHEVARPAPVYYPAAQPAPRPVYPAAQPVPRPVYPAAQPAYPAAQPAVRPAYPTAQPAYPTAQPAPRYESHHEQHGNVGMPAGARPAPVARPGYDPRKGVSHH